MEARYSVDVSDMEYVHYYLWGYEPKHSTPMFIGEVKGEALTTYTTDDFILCIF